MNKHFSDTLVEDIELDEAKKKKNQGIYSSISYTTGCPKYNMDMFNKLNGTDTSGALSGTIDGHASTQAMSADTGSGDAGAGDTGASAGGMGEALEKQDIDFLVKDEEEAIRGYEKKIEKADSDAEKEVLSHIKDEEEEHIDELNNLADIEKKAEEEKAALVEAKRYVRRYYIRPQNIFCSNKAEIIKALIDIGGDNCTIYTLNNLGDEKDVTKLTNDDVIYYYDDEILYDKNHLKVMDYDLAIKHEEERDKINVNAVSDATMKDVYYDRMTDVTELPESLEESALTEARAPSWGSAEKQAEFNRNWANKLNNGTASGIKSMLGSGVNVQYKAQNAKRYSNAGRYTITNFSVGKESHDLRATLQSVARANNTITLKVRDILNGIWKSNKTGKVYKLDIISKDLISRLETWLEDESSAAVATRGDKLISALSQEEQAQAKEYFANNIKTIEFVVPCGTSGYADDVGGAVGGKEFQRYAKKFDKLKWDMVAEFPEMRGMKNGDIKTIGHNITIELKEATDIPQKVLVWYDFVGKTCKTTFKQKFEDMPDLIKSIISGEKHRQESEESGAKEAKDTDNTINSVVLGQAIMSLFEPDRDFLAHPEKYNRTKSESLTENAHYCDSYKGYDIYREEDGTHAGEYWCQRGYTDQCWDAFFTTKQELKNYIDKYNSDYDNDEFDEAFDLMFEDIDATGKKLTEEDRTFTCCICGEEEKGYGNNPEPFKHEGRCCDACNIKFVIPARLAALKSDEE